MRNMAVLHSPAFSYPLPVLVRVLFNLLIFKGKILYYNKYSHKKLYSLWGHWLNARILFIFSSLYDIKWGWNLQTCKTCSTSTPTHVRVHYNVEKWENIRRMWQARVGGGQTDDAGESWNGGKHDGAQKVERGKGRDVTGSLVERGGTV